MQNYTYSDYKFVKEIGRGGMGCVYLGYTPTGQISAIKMMDCKYICNEDVRFFFDNEVKALQEMNHPSVVKILGEPFSDPQGNYYLPMEYVEGETLLQHVQHYGPYNETEARQLMSKILDAFIYIHQSGKIHRDIKPSNIMLRPDGSICVIDFGITKDMQTTTGKTIGMTVGTDGYMSPEQVKGLSIDYRTDIYSLGCLLHFMLTGQHAIAKQSNDYETKIAIINNEFPSARQLRPELSQDIQGIILKAVDKNMTLRFQTAVDFRNAISKPFNSSHTTQTVEQKTNVSGIQVTVGRQNCDINISNPYVSSNHLTIRFKEMPSSPVGSILEIEDHSTNGTGVNGRFLHNGSFSFDWSMETMEEKSLPEVLLAGRPELTLDWKNVIALIRPKVTIKTNAQPKQEIPQVKDSTIQEKTQSKQVTMLLWLSFIIPILGVIMWFIWRKDKPQQASKAIIFAAWGFAVYYTIIKTILKITK